MSKIIDFAKKGNVVRFFLGEDGLEEWWGDDWDDAPYDLNAGEVYDEYVSGHRDIAFPFDDMVLEPCEGSMNCGYCKEDMRKRLVPCVIVVPKRIYEDSWYTDFSHWAGADGVKRFFFGDKMEVYDAGQGESDQGT